MSVQSLTLENTGPAGPTSRDFERWLERISRQLEKCNQRQLLSIAGDDDWCYAVYQKLVAHFDAPILLSNRTELMGSLPFSKSETLLGSETHLVVVDLFSGLHPDVVCIAAGLVKSGGLLVILSPGAKRWQEVKDPYGVWQNGSCSSAHEFVHYFFDAIEREPEACICLRQGRELHQPPMPSALSATEIIDGKSLEQARVLADIKQWLTHGDEKYALLTADRGRGKSTCLGFAVKDVVEKQDLSVIVTACSRRSAAMLLSQCRAADFCAPDSLIEKSAAADLLVIDEAAMLPHSMLTQLCGRFKRILMATTTGGYEGTGQGFLLRFVARLNSSQLVRLKLKQPVRWAEHDCLERWINQTFLLESGAEKERSENRAGLADIRVEVKHEPLHLELLKDLYRLMTDAHYRTRPSDFRALMENPDLIPVVASRHDRLVALALANHEGGFDRHLNDEVFLGRRRPKGHLLAQMLTAQAGLPGFACFRGLRIQRIAVDEAMRLQGIGRSLIDHIEDYATKDDMDYFGACFALDSDSAGFWRSCGFRLVHIGHGQGKSTGNHSVAVIKIINPELEVEIVQLEQKLRSTLCLAFVQNLQRMPPQDVIALLRFVKFRTALSNIEQQEIRAFTQGDKGFELSFASLQKAIMQAVSESADGLIIHPWLIEKAIQNRAWNNLSQDAACKGKKAITKKLRELAGELIT